jgi:hypothetical protein
MSQYSRTAKPAADTTIPEEEIFAVDREEAAFTDGIASPGWVRRKTLGNGRVVHETLVAMVTPPTDEDFEEDDDAFPNEARTLEVDVLEIETSDGAGEWEEGEVETESNFVFLEVPIGTVVRLVAVVDAVPADDDTVTYKWYRVTDYCGDGSGLETYTFDSISAYSQTNTLVLNTTDIYTNQYDCDEDPGYIEYWVAARSILGAEPADYPQIAGFGLTMVPAEITIDTQPANISEDEGDPGSITIAASIDPAYAYTLAYQWFQVVEGDDGIELEDGVLFSGTTTDTLVIDDVTTLDGEEFYCIVSATGPAAVDAVTSTAASVTVVTE